MSTAAMQQKRLFGSEGVQTYPVDITLDQKKEFQQLKLTTKILSHFEDDTKSGKSPKSTKLNQYFAKNAQRLLCAKRDTLEESVSFFIGILINVNY